MEVIITSDNIYKKNGTGAEREREKVKFAQE
jgi:hypothetical protein